MGETGAARASRSPAKAGISMKINKIQICDRPIKDSWRRGGRDSARSGAGKTNPRGLSQAAAMRYRNSGANKPKPVIFLVIYLLQRKSARFSENMNAHDTRPIKDSVLILSGARSSLGTAGGIAGKRVGGLRAGRGGPRLVPGPSWPSNAESSAGETPALPAIETPPARNAQGPMSCSLHI